MGHCGGVRAACLVLVHAAGEVLHEDLLLLCHDCHEWLLLGYVLRSPLSRSLGGLSGLPGHITGGGCGDVGGGDVLLEQGSCRCFRHIHRLERCPLTCVAPCGGADPDPLLHHCHCGDDLARIDQLHNGGRLTLGLPSLTSRVFTYLGMVINRYHYEFYI